MSETETVVPESPELVAQEAADLAAEARVLAFRSDLLLARSELMDRCAEHEAALAGYTQQLADARVAIEEADAALAPVLADLARVENYLAESRREELDGEELDTVDLDERIRRDANWAGARMQRRKLRKAIQTRSAVASAERSQLGVLAQHIRHYQLALDESQALLASLDEDHSRVALMMSPARLKEVCPRTFEQLVDRNGLQLLSMPQLGRQNLSEVLKHVEARLEGSGALRDLVRHNRERFDREDRERAIAPFLVEPSLAGAGRFDQPQPVVPVTGNATPYQPPAAARVVTAGLPAAISPPGPRPFGQ